MFRELGELLVGRDSTALTELVKNSYDADAIGVTIYATSLGDPQRGVIIISDDGNGMSEKEFRDGFLRIAGRTKVGGTRLSPKLRRRYTGAKGIGRLAAHKLARHLHIISIPRDPKEPALEASIDWDMVESVSTLDQVASSGALKLRTFDRKSDQYHGTQITLSRLQGRWTSRERTRFVSEVGSAGPPSALISMIPSSICSFEPLFPAPLIQDISSSDGGMTVTLEGDFAVGDEYWQLLLESASWIIDIDASRPQDLIRVRSLPTRSLQRDFPDARPIDSSWRISDSERPPEFQARLLVRTGTPPGRANVNTWMNTIAGVRVFMEGFRVLPYGEAGNDWLSLDADNTRRVRALTHLNDLTGLDVDEAVREAQVEEGLSTLPNRQFFGGVFLTERGTPSLRMLVNREGFVPDAQFDDIRSIVRIAIDLNTRARVALRARGKEHAVTDSEKSSDGRRSTDTKVPLDAVLRGRLETSGKSIRSAGANLRQGKVEQAREDIVRARTALEDASTAEAELRSRRAMILVLASSGLQSAAFNHEIAGLLGVVQALYGELEHLGESNELSRSDRRTVMSARRTARDVLHGLERQAAYLVDIASADARRRRSRQRARSCFNAAIGVLQRAADAANISIQNRIDEDHRSLPMFRSELVSVFLNLLTNAIKAAGSDGRIDAYSQLVTRDDVELLVVDVQNTGASIDLEEAERWFLPFETTTQRADPLLGQGMGLGLTITRDLLEEYGGTVRFAIPRSPYTTRVEVTFPARGRS